MKAKAIQKILLLFILLLPAYATAASLGELRLSLIEGDVQIKTSDTSEWAPAAINFPLKDGDQLWVPEKGRAEVESRRGTIIRLDERTALDILTVDNDALQFYLSMGLAYVNAKGEKDTTLQMDTPLSSLRVFERAKFSAEIADDGDTEISVYLGSIAAENTKGETMVKAGNVLSLGRDSADLSPLGSIDAWERWNGDRDRGVEERRESVRYLPEELAGYSNDFDSNGEWVEMPSYGYVWRPTVQVENDWSPYRHGRWVWIGDDYVWIAQEQWGWAPYHYGRWSYIENNGWCWVPPARHEVYWGPGYVGWVRTPTYVSWVPLAPQEVYYGHGYYGPHSVDIMHIDVNKVIIKNTYKNVYVKNSVTTVHNDTFIRGKHVDFKVHENPFLKEKISVGRPQIQPERETKTATIREIPQSHEPPDMVKGAKMERLKEQHRFIKNQTKSVFQPETAPRAMTVEEKKEPRLRTDRKARLPEEESQRIAPQKIEAVQPTPAERQAPPESRREKSPRMQPATDDRQINREEPGHQMNRQVIQPPAPKEEALPTPAERQAPTSEPATPPPESRRERKLPEVDDRQLNRDEPSRQINRQAIQPPTPKEEAQTTPAGQGAPPTEPAAPPSERRRESRPRTQPESDDSQSNREERIHQMNRQEMPPPTPKEEAQTTPAGQGAPPLERRRESRPRQPEEEDKQLNLNREESNRQMNRQAIQPQAPKEETRTAPAERGVQSPEPAASRPESGRERNAKPQTEANDGQSNRDKKEAERKKKLKKDGQPEKEEVPAEKSPQ